MLSPTFLAACVSAALPAVAPPGRVCRSGSPEFRHAVRVDLLGLSADGAATSPGVRP